MELFAFDKPYVERLRAGEPSTEKHFVSYFGRLLDLMLRARHLPPEWVDDVRQETLSRVIAVVRQEGGIRQPERFGAFVNSVCKNVLRENTRVWCRTEALQQDHLDQPARDKIIDIEGTLLSKEITAKVHEILAEMRPRDRDLLRAIFLEEKEKEDVCQEFGVDRQYLRVLLHRAKERFRSSFQGSHESMPGRAAAGGSP